MRGELPARIPFVGYSGTRLLVNPAAARDIGLTIPATILSKADDVMGR
jgi:ABC-type uncharacterized transport system substrate-binding protein